MSHMFRAIVFGGYIPKSRIAPIIITLLYLLGIVSAYEHGTLCVSAVFHTYDIYLDGTIQSVIEESGLVTYQEGVNLTAVLVPNDLLTDDLTGSAKVHTLLKVGTHYCTLHGKWPSQADTPPSVPHISNITCDGTDRIWSITSSDEAYYIFIQIGTDSPITAFDMNNYNLYGKYCGSY
ncbi:hypothetical protein V1508DRAFT_428653 [Lipomyces doorenjongii]|uniref:uncharacterized protein n=1 Tax=Lipomyces doorenjongii TaxID=383834 RepID=UPI0034CD8D15